MTSTSDIAAAGARVAPGGSELGGRIVRGSRDRVPVGVQAGWEPGRVHPERLDTR